MPAKMTAIKKQGENLWPLNVESLDCMLQFVHTLIGFRHRHLKGGTENDQIPVCAVRLPVIGPEDQALILGVLDKLQREFCKFHFCS